MKKLYFLLLISFTAAGFAQNIVVNPTFADGLNGWSATGSNYALPTLITNDGQDDSFSVQYVATATTGFDQRFTVVPGATVEVSFWYKAVRTDGAATGNTARIWSVFQAEDTTTPINPPGTTGAANDPLRNNNGYLPQATTWTFVTVTSEVPVGASRFLLQLRAYNGATISFDNISFVSPGAALSTSSFNSIAGLSLYPNPVTNGMLNISTQANAERTVQIYDILGKQVVNKVTSNEAINVSNLNAGVYIVKITEEGKTASRKLVIN
ncbi:T9SS type A sorting domain-containing protein [Flavobacterium lacus]|uniref:Putative secreted protein (Por secretion system target) n=1 Tax=Flavobacterium lacus TaxID=1353778 RepID=A0A328WVJ4_9FLAO|nr:T9SS type A sorting domain-containing protein [Flavobacterium lacus]RAR50380.1 putative secreted protein (Por secretion system target) [Flavobacterium lacus]